MPVLTGVWVSVVLFLAGLVLIVKGGDWFLDGAVWMAEASGVPRFLIGATVVSLATTLPELTVSLTGVLQGARDLAVGNAVGSVAANLGLILGIGVLWAPGAAARRQLAPRALLMTAAAACLAALCRGGELAFPGWLALAAILAAYLAGSIREARRGMEQRRQAMPRGRTVSRRRMARELGLFALGAGAVALGSRLLVTHGSRLALLLGVPAGVVGSTVVAVGTSLPELVTTLTAVARRETALSVGNIVGANIIDLALILPACAAVSGGSLLIGPQTTGLDLPACLALCAAAVAPPLLTGRFHRWQGAALLGLYAGYLRLLLP
ncbi:sodium:calcium antiporter [Dysosmobacter sp. Phy]